MAAPTAGARKRMNGAAGGRVGDAISDLFGTQVQVATNATANVTSTYAHGLKDKDGNAVAPDAVFVAIGAGYVTAVDATNITYAGLLAGPLTLTLVIRGNAPDGYAKQRRPNH